MTVERRYFHQIHILSLLKSLIRDYSMNREKHVFALFAFLIMGLLLTSCTSLAASQPTSDVNSTIAALAQTVVVELNQTGTASVPTTTTSLLIPAPLPTSPVPTASATASPISYSLPVGCNNLKLLSAYTTAANPLRAGQSLTQSWQVQNNGTCNWDQSYRLVLISGEKLGASPGGLNQVIAPGKSIILTLDLVAPSQEGIYTSAWRFSDAAGTPFGETLSVSIAVRNNSESTSTPNPAQTTAYVQTYVADQMTANAIGRETADAYMTSDFATLMSSMYGSSTAIAATNEALGSATPQP